MKYLCFILILISTSVRAQLSNGDFETWSSGLPYYWETGNLPYMAEGIMQDADAHGGLYSVRGQVVNYYSRPYAPYLSNPIGSVGFGMTAQHDTVTGWYKTNLMTGDVFFGKIVCYDATQYPIAIGQFSITANAGSWTQFAVPIQYYGAGAAAYGAMYFTITDSTGLASGQIGSWFKLDDLQVTGP